MTKGLAYKSAVRWLAFLDASRGLQMAPTEGEVGAGYALFKHLLVNGEFGGDPDLALAGLRRMVERRWGSLGGWLEETHKNV
jgi:hypothetical protein